MFDMVLLNHSFETFAQNVFEIIFPAAKRIVKTCCGFAGHTVRRGAKVSTTSSSSKMLLEAEHQLRLGRFTGTFAEYNGAFVRVHVSVSVCDEGACQPCSCVYHHM